MKKNRVKIIYLIVIFTCLLSLFTISYAANTVISGSGSMNSPYVLDFDLATPLQGGAGKYLEISCKKDANFWFQIKEDATNKYAGTYGVEYDKEAQKVRFIYFNSNNQIFYPKGHPEDGKYVQAGVKPEINTNAVEPEKKDVTFVIVTREEAKENYFWNYIVSKGGLSSTPYEYQLKNTFLPGGDLYTQHPSYFVFVPTGGTVKDLYEDSSKAACKDSAYPNHIRYTSKYAEYIIDSRVPVWANLNKTLDYPTRVVRFGNWDGTNIKDTDKHTLEIKYHFILRDIEPEEQAGVIEFAITKLLLGVGDVFIAITKAFLGDSVTMDSIIFNKYESIVIDFRGRVGFLANEEVKKIINYMYAGFEKIAIVVNLVVLLYLGIQIVANIGGEKQSKYFKNLQNWCVGIIILFVGPRLFPFLTDISNAIVGYIGTAVTPYVTQYNIEAMLNDDALLGEDAETVSLEEQIAEGIKIKTAQQEKVESDIKALEAQGNDKYQVIKKYDSFMDSVADLVAGVIQTVNPSFDVAAYKVEMDFERYVNEIKEYIEVNRANWTSVNDVELETKINNFNNKWTAEATYPVCPEHGIVCLLSCEKIYPVQAANVFFTEYKELQLKCAELERQLSSLHSYKNSKDLMGEMRIRAGQTGRLAYAIVWFILFFQLISLLALYYKRLIVISILIMLFPVVMITYAIDKIGDGAAQSFEAWTKEFTVNILVQIAHAIVYVTLIQTGISFYESNPNNWLFFIIAVLCLFPMEKMIRSMFGMNGNTIDNLKSNVLGGSLVAVGAIRAGIKGGKGMVHLAKDIKKDGVAGTIKNKANNVKNRVKNSWNKFNDAEDKKNAAKDQRARKRQAVADRKNRTRNTNIQRRRQQMSSVGAIKRFGYRTLNGVSRMRNLMYHGGNFGRKIKGIARKPLVRNAGKAFKLAGIAAKKVGGLAGGTVFGATNAIMSAGKGAGLIGSVGRGAKEGRDVRRLIDNSRPQRRPQRKNPPRANAALPQDTKRKNMPGGQKAKGIPKPAEKRVSKASTRDGRYGRTKIRGAKKMHKTERKTYRQTITTVDDGSGTNNRT